MRALQPKRVAVAGVALIGGLAAPLVLAPSAGAATITVTSTLDGGPGSLRDAFDQANTNTGPNTIVLAANTTYNLTDCVKAALTSTAGPLEIQGNGSTIHQTCLADGVNPDPGVIVQQDPSLLTITGTTISGGNLTSGNGGGISATGPVTLVNSTVTANSAPVGGGISSFSGNVTLTNSHVDANTGLVMGGIFGAGSVVLTDSSVSANKGGVAVGGINAPGDITLTNSHVDDNAGLGLSGAGAVSITDSTVSRNAKGGAVGTTSISVTNSVVAGNTGAAGNGAGISSSGHAVVAGSTIADNIGTGDGGGIFATDLDLSFSSVTGNQGATGGGGISVETGVTAVNSTVTSNVSGVVGGISAGGTVNLRYVTLAANGGPTASQLGAAALDSAATVVGVGSGGASCLVAGATTSGGYNYEQTSNTCGFAGTGDVASGADPQLLALAANGGPTMTHLFATGSGLHDAIPAATGLCTGTAKDQRGYSRPQGVGCDIGAVEMRLPTASNGSATTTVGVPVNTDLHPLVADPDGWLAGATYSVNPPPANGTTQTTGNGQVLYTPGGGFAGSDAYGYVVTDSRKVSSVSATINVTVTGTPPAPANPASPISATPAFTG